MSLAKIREAPQRSLMLLIGPPGAGKSTFCHQMILDSVAAGRSVLLVTTERSVPDIIGILSEKGLGKSTPEALSFGIDGSSHGFSSYSRGEIPNGAKDGRRKVRKGGRETPDGCGIE